MINSLIKKTLDSINIESFYLKTTTKNEKYCVFSIFSEKDAEVLDNKSRATIYYVTINYWYSKNYPSFLSKYKDIKNAMKRNGFKFLGCSELESGDYFGKNMDFKIKTWEE